MSTRSEDEVRRRELIASIARRMWLEEKSVKEIEKETGATYHLFKCCITEKEPEFFFLHERKRGRKFQYRDRLEPQELAECVRMYLLKEKKLWQISAQYKVAPYLLRKLLKDAGVWRSQGRPAFVNNEEAESE